MSVRYSTPLPSNRCLVDVMRKHVGPGAPHVYYNPTDHSLEIWMNGQMTTLEMVFVSKLNPEELVAMIMLRCP